MREPDDAPLPPLPPELAALSGAGLGQALLDSSAKLLLQRILAGTATAADIAVARAICKDSGYQLAPTPKSPGRALAGALTDRLPFAGEPAEPLQ